MGLPQDPSRRNFLRAGAAVAATAATTAGASSCVGDALLARRQVRGACHHDCPETCAWIVAVEGDRAVGFRGDPDHPYTDGRLCGAMDGYLGDVVYNPDRLLHPLKRIGPKGEGRFERVGWDEALDDVAARLRQAIDAHGAETVLPYNFAGTIGVAQGWSLDQRFFSRLGASELAHTICGSTASAGLTATLGTDTGILQEDLLDSRLILMWGGNPVVTNPHGWRYVQRARQAGATLISIDPLRSATAEQADRHLRPRPGTDAALALGLMHAIVAEDLHDADYLGRHTVGWERLRAQLTDYPPQRVAEWTGVPAEEIVRLAREYAGTRPAAIQVHIGMEKHRHGGMSYRAIACLPAVVGAWRDPGGGLVYSSSGLFGAGIDWAALTDSGPDAPPRRAISMSQLGRALEGELPATDGGAAVGGPFAPLDPPVTALIVYNSNPATIAPDQNRVLRGLRRDDLFTVVLEQFMTDTARHADYVFPATTQLEHLDLIVPYGSRFLALNRPAIQPQGEARPNTAFFRALAPRLGLDDPALQATDEELVRTAIETKGSPRIEGISYERLVAEGWASPNVPERRLPFAEGGFPTPSGKCELVSAAWERDGRGALPAYLPVERAPDDVAAHPLHFMSPKWNPNFVNSSHASQPRLEAASGTPRLRIHPDDARARGIADGARVRVFNDRGEIALRAEVTDAMRTGVVAMLHGWWASRIGGSSANALTSGDVLADAGGGSSLHDTWVEVARIAAGRTSAEG